MSDAAKEPPDLGDLIGTAMIRLMRQHRNAVAAELAAVGLHVGQEWILMQLWRHDGGSQADLSRELGVEQPTIAKAVRRLEAAGFLRRTPDSSDARITQVWLTEQGRSAWQDVAERWEAIDKQMLAGITAEEQRALRGLLGRMADNLHSDTAH